MIKSIIAAVADNGVIGKTGTLLPWRLSADLAYFKKVTFGHSIIMGSKTFKTIGKPLPGRKNIVISSNPNLVADRCIVVGSIEKAFAAAKDESEVFICGGGSVYEQTLPFADKLYLTQVHAKPEGDVFFSYDTSDWREIYREDHLKDEKNPFDYSFVVLERKSN